MLPLRRFVSLAVVLPGLLASLNASAGEAQQGWQQTVFVYGMGAAMDGTAEIGNVKVPVDLSASDILDMLEFGAMAAYRVDNGTWSFTGDATFMGLGSWDRTQGGRVKGEIDVDQLTVMGTFGRRWTDHLEFLFGLAYVDLTADLKVTGELGNFKAGRDADWIDPTIGLQYNRPFADNWRFNLRGDIGGFGVGSDFMYHLLGSVRWQASDTVGVFAGYRLISFDYEDGAGRDYQHYDLTEQGPLVGVSVSF
jgi:hypothetical protein